MPNFGSIGVYLHRFKFLLLWPFVKSGVDLFIIIYALTQKIYIFEPNSVVVYMVVSKDRFSISLLSMLGFSRHFPGIKFSILSDGTLSKLQLAIYQRIGLNISLVTEVQKQSSQKRIQKFPYILKCYEYGWSGKKFLLPLLLNPDKKFIVLDTDVLTYTFPGRIETWIKNDEAGCLYMQDYANFSAISSVEAQQILGKKTRLSKINSGFLCINPTQFLKSNSFAILNQDIAQVVAFTKDRLRYDEKVSNDIYYVYPIIEQTLFWLGFERCRAEPLNPEKYFIFPNHKFNKKKIQNPVVIHFSGEGTKKSMYKYLVHTLVEKLKDNVINKASSNKPWYIYSEEFCPGCGHR